MNRRGLLAALLGLAVTGATVTAAEAQDSGIFFFKRRKRAAAAGKPSRRSKQAQSRKKPQKRVKRATYAGRRIVPFSSSEKPGTIIIRTSERALYQVKGNGKAMRYLVAVGKEGFSWSGTARVGMKRVNPTWTPPAEMIARTPRYARWASGMPGGIPENPLGVRALYLFKGGRDTMFRIHGTNAPSSIGTAASSGCIRMLNHEVVELYNSTPKGTKVIVM